MAHNKNKGLNELLSGLSMTAVFSALWLFQGWTIWIFPLVFAGILPMLNGVSKMVTEKVDRKERSAIEHRNHAIKERDVLRVAKMEKGRVTPATVALNSNMSIEEADTLLQEFAGKGYASMEVTGEGRVEYIFREFLPQIEED